MFLGFAIPIPQQLTLCSREISSRLEIGKSVFNCAVQLSGCLVIFGFVNNFFVNFQENNSGGKLSAKDWVNFRVSSYSI